MRSDVGVAEKMKRSPFADEKPEVEDHTEELVKPQEDCSDSDPDGAWEFLKRSKVTASACD